MQHTVTHTDGDERYRIMLVDDEDGILRAIKRELAKEPYELETFTDAAQALDRFSMVEFDLVIADYRMPGMDGVTMLTEIKKIRPDTIRIVLSGTADLEVLVEAINKAEIYRFIGKPWVDYELKIIIAQALEFCRIQKENRRLTEQVRKQQDQLKKQQDILEKLESESPGISHVERADDGSIIIDENDV